MAWRDEMMPASFRGAAFEVIGAKTSAGRRLARHEYPQRDIPYLEDMGRRAREYKVEAYIVGPDYMTGRDALLAAIEQEGAGQLVHPYHGTQLVTVSDCELDESTEFGGMAKFSLTFIEAGEQLQPSVGTDSAIVLAAAQESAFDAVSTDFASGFSVARLPSWGVGDIESTISGAMGLDDLRRVSSMAQAFSGKVRGLMGLPGSLASSVISLVRSLGRAASILDRSNRLPSSSIKTSTRSAVRQQQAVVTALIKRSALIQEAGALASAEYATSADVQAARAEVIKRFDEHDYAVDAIRPSAEAALQLKAVRSAALAHLANQGASLSQSYTLQLQQSQPGLALSYALYGDLRTDEIVRRNGIRHPGFVPAGVPLQLTAE